MGVKLFGREYCWRCVGTHQTVRNETQVRCSRCGAFLRLWRALRGMVLLAIVVLAVGGWSTGAETTDPEAASYCVRAGDSGGSGTAIGPGLLVTNVHVASNSWQHIEATHPDHPDQVWVGRTVLQMPTADLALVAFSAQPELSYVELASDSVGTGDKVTLCGYGRQRRLRKGSGTIQSDDGKRAYTNVNVLEPLIDGEPGDSGGGLFNDDGELVGVNWGGNDDGGAATPVRYVAKLASDAVDQGLVETYQCGDGPCFRGGMSGGGGRLSPMVPVERPNGSRPAPTLDPEPPTAEEAEARKPKPAPVPQPPPNYVTPDQLAKSQTEQDAALQSKLDALGKQISDVGTSLQSSVGSLQQKIDGLRSDAAKADDELGGLVGQLTEQVAANDQQLSQSVEGHDKKFGELGERIKGLATVEALHKVATSVTKKTIEATGKEAVAPAAATWLGLPMTGMVLAAVGISSGPLALLILGGMWIFRRRVGRPVVTKIVRDVEHRVSGGGGAAPDDPFPLM